MIAFLDIEASPLTKTLQHIGICIGGKLLDSTSIDEIKELIIKENAAFICGHNFLDYDLKILENTALTSLFKSLPIIDTLYLSMLLDTTKDSHKLQKTYKNNPNEKNIPSNDSGETKLVFQYLDEKFNSLPKSLSDIFIYLLFESPYFKGFFAYKNITKKT